MEKMSLFKARSFWLIVAALLLGKAQAAGVNLYVTESQLADALMDAAPALLGLWAYVERFFGKKRLVVRNA